MAARGDILWWFNHSGGHNKRGRKLKKKKRKNKETGRVGRTMGDDREQGCSVALVDLHPSPKRFINKKNEAFKPSGLFQIWETRQTSQRATKSAQSDQILIPTSPCQQVLLQWSIQQLVTKLSKSPIHKSTFGVVVLNLGSNAQRWLVEKGAVDS